MKLYRVFEITPCSDRKVKEYGLYSTNMAALNVARKLIKKRGYPSEWMDRLLLTGRTGWMHVIEIREYIVDKELGGLDGAK